MKKLAFPLLGIVLSVFVLVRCGSSSSSSTGSCSATSSASSASTAAAIPAMAFTSPMASCTNASASIQKNSFFASLGGVFQKLTRALIGSSKQAAAGDIKNAANAANDLKAILDATTAAGCVTGVGTLTPAIAAVDCYGPGLNYTNHPDGAPSNGNLPTGDLGIYSAAEADGEACAAAKSNAIVQNISDTVNGALKMAAAVACLLKVQGEALPTSGTSTNMATLWNSSAPSSGVTLTTATIAFVSANKYTTTITGSGTANGAFNIVLTNTKTDATTFSGRVYGYFKPTTLTKNVGFSVVYSNSGTTLTAVGKSGDNTAGSSTAFFDASNNFDFSKAAFTANGYYNLISIDTSTGLGTIYSTWQAGTGDSHGRVFRANTSRDSAGNDIGYAYFGYGPKVTEAGVGTINRMICNWAGPGNNHTGLTNKAQGQVLARNSAGLFASSTNYITYAPTNSCDNSSSTFQTGVTGATQTAVGTVTNNLVAVDALGTIPTVTEPTY